MRPFWVRKSHLYMNISKEQIDDLNAVVKVDISKEDYQQDIAHATLFLRIK